MHSLSTLSKMALLLVFLTTILAFSLVSTDQCVSSPGSSIDLTLRSHKNASGDWIITVETRRSTTEEDPREILVNAHQETKICGRKEIEQLIAVALVYPSLHDTVMSGTIKPSTTTTTTSTTTPKSCPHPGYQLFREFNCYKVFREMKSWGDAREQCMRDGGDLMVMETERERQDVYIPLRNSLRVYTSPWVGVYIAQGADCWMTVKGEPALGTRWWPGYPEKNAASKCAFAVYTGLLGNVDCGITKNFICEIGI